MFMSLAWLTCLAVKKLIKKIEGHMKTSNKIVIFFFGALGGLLFGYDTGIIASALVYIKGDLQLTPIGEAWVVSGIILGAAIGAIGSGFLSDKVGRKKVVFIEAVIFTAGSLGCALSITATQLILFRFVLGLAVGGASALVPLYLSEMAPKEIRGALSALNQVMIITGIVMASIIGYILTSSADGWRIMLGLGVVPSIIMALGALMIPESPRWLIAKNKEAEARAVLLKTRSQTIAEEEIIEIKRVVALEDKGIREITDKWVRPLLWLGIFLAILQQFTGINAVVYFTPTILVGLGVAPADAILYNVGLGVVMLIMTIIATQLIDKVGRKNLLIYGNASMSLCLIVLAAISKVLGNNDGNIVWVTVGAFIVFIAAFSLTWGPVVWVLLGEIFPLQVRGAAMSIATLALWIANFIVSFTFPILLSWSGISMAFIIYGVIGLTSLFYVRHYVVETKGRSLEEIEQDFRKIHIT